MPHSHHSHSGQFCRHAAQGTTLEDVVKRAIEKGFKVYGLTEHCPRYRQQDLYPEEVSSGMSPVFPRHLLAPSSLPVCTLANDDASPPSQT